MKTVTPPLYIILLSLFASILLSACSSSGSGGVARDAQNFLYIASDGNALNGLNQLFISKDQNSEPLMLSQSNVANDSNILSFAMSPDKQWVAYAADHQGGGGYKIYVVAITGGTSVSVAANRYPDDAIGNFRWSPDSQQIAYTAKKVAFFMNGRTPSQVYVVNRDGSNDIRISGSVGTNADVEVKSPQWSSNGRYIVQEVFTYNFSSATALNIYDTTVGSANSRRLITEQGSLRGVRWSPTAERLTYRVDENDNGDYIFFAINVDGSNYISLSSFVDFNEEAEWNADGSLLAFYETADNMVSSDLVVVPSEDAINKRIIDNRAGLAIRYFQWSPDGTQIAYNIDKNTPNQYELYIAPVDGSQPARKLSASLIAEGDVLEFGWSPDAKNLAYMADQETDTVRELYVVSVATGAVKKMNSGDVEVVEFAWATDSQRIIFTAGDAARNPVPNQLYSNSLQANDRKLLNDMNTTKIFNLQY